MTNIALYQKISNKINYLKQQNKKPKYIILGKQEFSELLLLLDPIIMLTKHQNSTVIDYSNLKYLWGLKLIPSKREKYCCVLSKNK